MKNNEWAPGVYEEFKEAALDNYDFVTCIRGDGSYYGNGGTKCVKGSKATKKDLAAEKKKAKAGDKEAAKRVAKMEKYGVDGPSPKAKAASAAKPKGESKKKGDPDLQTQYTDLAKQAQKAMAKGDMDKALKLNKEAMAVMSKIQAQEEKASPEVKRREEKVGKVVESLKKTKASNVTSDSEGAYITDKVGANKVKTLITPKTDGSYEIGYKVNDSYTKGGVTDRREQVRVALTAKRQFDSALSSFPDGTKIRAIAYDDDGGGDTRRKAYEKLGFKHQGNNVMTGVVSRGKIEGMDFAEKMSSEEKLWFQIIFAGKTGKKNDFSETDAYDFMRCQRPDGSIYGTGGTCRKGTPVGDDVKAEKKEEVKTKGAHDYPKGGTGGGEVPGSPNIKTYQAQIDKANKALKADPDDEFAKFVKEDAERRMKPIQDSQKMVDGVVKDVPKGTEVKMNPFGGLETEFTTPGGNVVKTYLMKRDFAFTVNGEYNAGAADGNRAEQLAISRQVQRVFNAQVKNAPPGLILETSAWKDDGRGSSRERAYQRIGFAKPTAGGAMYGQIINGKLVPVDPSQVEDTSMLITFNESTWCYAEEVKKEEDAWFEIVFGEKP